MLIYPKLCVTWRVVYGGARELASAGPPLSTTKGRLLWTGPDQQLDPRFVTMFKSEVLVLSLLPSTAIFPAQVPAVTNSSAPPRRDEREQTFRSRPR